MRAEGESMATAVRTCMTRAMTMKMNSMLYTWANENMFSHLVQKLDEVKWKKEMRK